MKVIRTEEDELVTVPNRPDYHRCLDPETYDEKLENIAGIEKVLAQITFAPSCVDMNWGWQVEEVWGPKGDAFDPIAYRLRTSFQRPDRETGKLETGWGRWWEVPKDITVSGVVKTAYAAARMILEHELMESFKWKNARVFDPHNTVQELARLGSARYVDGIP
jgi:hypothetical protein